MPKLFSDTKAHKAGAERIKQANQPPVAPPLRPMPPAEIRSIDAVIDEHEPSDQIHADSGTPSVPESEATTGQQTSTSLQEEQQSRPATPVPEQAAAVAEPAPIVSDAQAAGVSLEAEQPPPVAKDLYEPEAAAPTTDQVPAPRSETPAAHPADQEDFQQVGQVISIPVGEIVDSDYQPRLEYDEEVLSNYEESIRLQGQIEPIKVRRVGTKFELLDGHYRLRVIRDRLNWSHIAAIVHTLDDQKARLFVMVATEGRTDISSFERSEMYWKAIDAGEKQADLARQIGVSRAHISQCLIFKRLPEECRAILRRRPRLMSYRTAAEVVRLIDSQPLERQKIVDAVLSIAETREQMIVQNGGNAKGHGLEMSVGEIKKWVAGPDPSDRKDAPSRQSRLLTSKNGVRQIEIKPAKSGDRLGITVFDPNLDMVKLENVIYEALQMHLSKVRA